MAKWTPAIVLDSHHHIGLGITRSLGRLGVAVFNVDSSPWSPAFSSIYCAGRHVWNFEEKSAEECLRFLVSLAKEIGSRCFLIPASDVTTTFVAEQAEQLERWFLFTRQDPALIRALCNKKEMHALARSAGIPTPETTWPKTRAELARCFQDSRFPLVVKLSDGGHRRHNRATKVVVRTIEEALDLSERIGDGVLRNLIVQDWIPEEPKTDWMFNGYFNERSECLAAFTGRKVRQFPVNMGVASLGVCEHNPALERAAVAFLTNIGYYGAVDMDFRYDTRDGQYKLLDVNPRIGGSFELFVTEDGTDVVRALYLDRTGKPVRQATAIEGRRWAVEDYDLLSAAQSCWRGPLRLGQWLRSCRGCGGAFFSLDDPMPVFSMLRYDTTKLFDRLNLFGPPEQPFESIARAAMPPLNPNTLQREHDSTVTDSYS
jgi:predicted ATP-grasp superfamily ATP-dependent carboligase